MHDTVQFNSIIIIWLHFQLYPKVDYLPWVPQHSLLILREGNYLYVCVWGGANLIICWRSSYFWRFNPLNKMSQMLSIPVFWWRLRWEPWILNKRNVCGANVDGDWERSPWRSRTSFSEAEVVVFLPSIPHCARCSWCRPRLVWVI